MSCGRNFAAHFVLQLYFHTNKVLVKKVAFANGFEA